MALTLVVFDEKAIHIHKLMQSNLHSTTHYALLSAMYFLKLAKLYAVCQACSQCHEDNFEELVFHLFGDCVILWPEELSHPPPPVPKIVNIPFTRTQTLTHYACNWLPRSTQGILTLGYQPLLH